jgi:hypothetical protein
VDDGGRLGVEVTAVPKQVVNGAKLSCNQGTSPSTLTVLPAIETEGDDQPAATINDHIPMTNVAPFGMCQSAANPQVAAAQGAPQPCIPVLPAPWSPGASVVTIQGIKALSDNSTCSCTWAGTVSITNPGTTTEIDVE